MVSEPDEAPFSQSSGSNYHSAKEPTNAFQLYSTSNGMERGYVVGFMDFDPKFAARSAHRNGSSLKRWEPSWLNKQ